MNLGQIGKMQLGRDRSGNTSYVRTTPWGGPVGRFWNPENKIPCNAPPFGELVAVNVNTGDIAWHVPLGFVEELKAKGLADTGALNMGGPIVTASGLVFVGASNDRRFRAFDSKTGKQLWETELDASAHSVPMTFLGKDNRQYVVVAAGGGSFLASAPGTKIVAFALPGGSRQTSASVSPVAPGPAAATQAGTGELPPGEGRDSVARLCGSCHGLSTVTGARRTATDWKRITDDMLARGNQGTPSDSAAIAAYLTARFGRVDVNTADQLELSQVLDLTRGGGRGDRRVPDTRGAHSHVRRSAERSGSRIRQVATPARSRHRRWSMINGSRHAEREVRKDTMTSRMSRGVAGLTLLLACAVVAGLGAQRGGGADQAGRGAGRGQARPKVRKTVLAWADTRNGIAQHDSTSHALAVIERLGYESGAYDTYIRTDSNIIADKPLMTTGGPASGGPSLAECRCDLLSRTSRRPARSAAANRVGGVRS